MSHRLANVRRLTIKCSVAVLGTAIILSASAQTPPAAVAPAAKQAIDVRKATFTLIGSNFRPIGEVLQGRTAYESVDLQKSASRVAFLAGLLSDAFPDISATGDTRAKPEIWSDRANFDKRLKAFQDDTAALAQVVASGKNGADAFKTAAGTVAQDCKGCHESYKVK